ncbi:MAG: hypothetical protein IPK20_25750, partial [Betaproteobacteria bacterium]|nr:hypothetical protein [Betaproteobacteria bacterium]
MGEDLADGRPEVFASGREWRTPPLPSIGHLSEVINGAGAFLHHRWPARHFEEAILWHGGEAKSSRDAFAGAERRDCSADRLPEVAFLEETARRSGGPRSNHDHSVGPSSGISP